MMAGLVWALGLVLCFEGLVLALAPSRLDAALDMLRRMPIEARRLAGLSAMAVGALVLGLARLMGA